jgi:hypothetical protein
MVLLFAKNVKTDLSPLPKIIINMTQQQTTNNKQVTNKPFSTTKAPTTTSFGTTTLEITL